MKVTYPTVEQAELARSNLNNHEFQGTSLRTKPVKVWIHHLIAHCALVVLIDCDVLLPPLFAADHPG